MSDHISGPRALADPIADITDVYAFPSPERPGNLVLVDEHASVCETHRRVLRRPHLPIPSAPAHARLRRADPAPFVAGQPELVFDCVFSAPVRPAVVSALIRRSPAAPQPVTRFRCE